MEGDEKEKSYLSVIYVDLFVKPGFHFISLFITKTLFPLFTRTRFALFIFTF
jgi:hypothetical protein